VKAAKALYPREVDVSGYEIPQNFEGKPSKLTRILFHTTYSIITSFPFGKTGSPTEIFPDDKKMFLDSDKTILFLP